LRRPCHGISHCFDKGTRSTHLFQDGFVGLLVPVQPATTTPGYHRRRVLQLPFFEQAGKGNMEQEVVVLCRRR
jgi:hypothetical protein